jgi:hypothetical protein
VAADQTASDRADGGAFSYRRAKNLRVRGADTNQRERNSHEDRFHCDNETKIPQPDIQSIWRRAEE